MLLRDDFTFSLNLQMTILLDSVYVYFMKIFAFILAFTFAISQFACGADFLIPEKPMKLAGIAGRFDFMSSDPVSAKIIAAHVGAKSVEVIDTKTGLVTSLHVGSAQGVAVDSKNHKFFSGNGNEHKVVIMSSDSMTKLSEVKLSGPVDAIAFDLKNEMIYAAEDDGSQVWVIDPKSSKLVTTIKIPGIPEVLDYDLASDSLYLNLKNRDSVLKINPAKNTVEANWSTLPAKLPHGLAIDTKRGWVFVAGANGKLVSLDIMSGKLISSVSIVEGADQIAYDEQVNVIYSACQGFVSVTRVTDAGLEAIGEIVSPKGAHTLALDRNSHDVWISYSDLKFSYLQKFKPAL